MRKIFLLLSTMAATLAVTALPAQAAPNPRVFVSIPDQMPGNVVSLGFEATQTDELGDQIRLAPGKRALKTVTVVMSSWACESGSWNAGCTTTPGAKFQESVTLTLYQIHPSDPNLPGPVIASRTRTFSMPYRPSANPTKCGTGATQWYSSADDDCYNGKAFKITFNFARPNLVLPDELIYGIAYDTSTSGNTPHGARPCQATTEGCPDDSLNVGIEAGLPKRGTDLLPDGVFIDQQLGGDCTSPPDGLPDVFSLDACTWQGYNPMVRFVVKS
jgi:hypothetical protein